MGTFRGILNERQESPPALPEVAMENLFTRIEDLCQEKNMRPGRLCDELGLSRSLMTDLKMGRKKTVNAETAQKIAEFFGVSVGFLLGQTEERGQQSDILDKVDVAFYGEFKELNDEDKETVRDMVRLMRERRAAKQRD
jgi:transcriptional regulator with XRE-family HTH domain